MTIGFPIPLGYPVALGYPPGDYTPPPTPSRRFVVPGVARRAAVPSLRPVAPEKAEARPGPVLVE